MSLQDAVENCTPERVDDVLDLAGAFVAHGHAPDEAIGLAGLNPHAGENGLFGRQDADVLAPAVTRARARGITRTARSPPTPCSRPRCKGNGTSSSPAITIRGTRRSRRSTATQA